MISLYHLLYANIFSFIDLIKNIITPANKIKNTISKNIFTTSKGFIIFLYFNN